jgi:DNA-3-methyladenine glycosylase I
VIIAPPRRWPARQSAARGLASRRPPPPPSRHAAASSIEILAPERWFVKPPAAGLVLGGDRKARCVWGASTPEYERYHDEEWGQPVEDDRRLFEKLCLEGFQAGLSWLTILRKRESFRAAFAGFDPTVVAGYGAREVKRLLANAEIVRHRGKIESTINNASRALELIASHGSLAAYLWQFEPAAIERPKQLTWAALRAMTTSPSSIALSKDLKKRGWTFVGPTTMYAFMQAMGMVNDHVEGCHARARTQKARRAFSPPRPRQPLAGP